jgi:U4/U6.U5 tri-snRNP-associated protein 2
VRTVGEPPAGDGVGTSETAETEGVTTQTVPFKMLALDLPPPPLFQDSMEKNIIPQVSIVELLKKYDGVSTTATPRGGLRTHRLTQLPEYLIVHYKRFTKNAFFREKNNTIVTFPTKTPLRLAEHVPCPVDAKTGAQQNSTYVLVANVCHDGPPDGGTFRAQVFHNADSHWYDISDLQVEETLAQQVALTETYVQIWERRAGTGPGLGGARAKKNAHAEEDPFGLGDLGGDDMVE